MPALRLPFFSQVTFLFSSLSTKAPASVALGHV
jgi:hypothetical protein